MEFIFNKKARIAFSILMLIGVIAMIFGYINDESSHHNRFWANIFINGFFYFGISIGALFFLALQYATEASYMVVLKRVFEAVSQFIYVGSAILIIFFLAGTFQWHHIYHWMDPEVFNIESPAYDAIIAAKQVYLNQPFFWLRTLLFIGVWCYFTHLFRKRSLLEDELGGTKIHYKNITTSAIFIVFFGFTSSIASWDWIMSIDTHWFSTLFGWYVFASFIVSAVTVIALVTLYLKSKGYLEFVNTSHVHDLAKFMFGFSIFWTYLWFSQFMLQWYSNIPEEVTYYVFRIEEYNLPFFLMLPLNFVLPVLLLINTDFKRLSWIIVMAGIAILVGHYLDFFTMIMPGTVGANWSIGAAEIGSILFFGGLFIYVGFNAMTKAPLLVKNDPYIEESKHFHY